MWINPGYLVEKLDNDDQSVAELLVIFLTEYERLVGELQDALSQNQPTNRLGHSLKGMCLDIGADRLSQLAAALEQDNGDPRQLTAELAAAIQPIREEVALLIR